MNHFLIVQSLLNDPNLILKNRKTLFFRGDYYSKIQMFSNIEKNNEN